MSQQPQTQSQALVQDIGERLAAADLIESRHLLQYTNSLKTDYLVKQPLMRQQQNYLDIAHLLPERERSRYGDGVRSMPLAGDMYQPGKGGKDIGKLLKNEYLNSTSLKEGMYLPINIMDMKYGDL